MRDFLSEINSFYIATATLDGQPYIEHSGGPKGFLKVLDDKILAFADFSGNRQYISVGNLDESDKAYIFLMDYAHRRRIKIWGRAWVEENDSNLLESLVDESYRARPERAILFEIAAWDVNCPQHIPQKIDIDDVQKAHSNLLQRIEELELELAQLKGASEEN